MTKVMTNQEQTNELSSKHCTSISYEKMPPNTSMFVHKKKIVTKQKQYVEDDMVRDDCRKALYIRLIS